MKMNPICKREMTVSSRSFRLPLIIILFNSILALAALLNMYSTISQVRLTAEIQYSNFLELYVFVATIEFILLLFIMPALTSGSISGERERQTLDLMLTTNMKPVDIVIGKLTASFTQIFLLVISSFPLIALVFVYGGITEKDLGILLLCYITAALFAGSIGICSSSLFKRSTIATVVSYASIIVVVAGTYAVNIFALSLARMNPDSYYANAVGTAAKQANSGGLIYTLLPNPVTTFMILLNQQAGSDTMYQIDRWFGVQETNVIMDHWVLCSLGIQLLLSVLLVFVAVKALKRK
ncbi:MAG: ABC transporter permease [Lachnospiraceae bacterium]